LHFSRTSLGRGWASASPKFESEAPAEGRLGRLIKPASETRAAWLKKVWKQCASLREAIRHSAHRGRTAGLPSASSRCAEEAVFQLKPFDDREGVVTSLWRCGPTGDPVAQEDEENQIRRVPVPARDHSAVDLAPSSIHIEFPRHRRFISGTWHRGFIRDSPALVNHFGPWLMPALRLT
jgi:hypothetical protein